MEINLYEILLYFLLLLIYSFFGWAIETTGELIKSKKFVNRGFLLGPICPIYGVGAVLITLFLNRYYDDIFAIFGLSAILCGFLEYMTSLLMEKLFKARWWDYSNQKFNINGRICLETITLFAIAGVIIIRFLSPTFLKLIGLVPNNISLYVSIILFIIFLVDISISFNVMNKIKNVKESVASNLKDNTEEISTRVREILLEKSLPYRRILEAFPQAFADRVKLSTEKLAKAAETVRENVIIAKDRTIKNINDIKNKTIKGFNTAKHNTVARIRLLDIRVNKDYNYIKENIRFKDLIHIPKNDKNK